MTSIMLSIQPKWCEKIASGEKTIEVRKNRPKLETPFKCYIYCTKSEMYYGNGKVIGEFVCDTIIRSQAYCKFWNCLVGKVFEVNEMPDSYMWHISNLKIYDKPKELKEFGKKCESANEIHCRGCLNKNDSDFCEKMIKPLTRPPQSWCYVEEEE